MKVLADHEIKAAIARRELVLDAVSEGCIGACYELRMGSVYYDLTDGERRIEVPSGGDVLIKPGHRVVLITRERLVLSASMFARIISKGSLFSIGLSPVATYADPGFEGRIGIVTQNISEKYIVLPALEPIAKADFTLLETPAERPYRGQHGFETEIWPIKHQFQKTLDELAGDRRLSAATPLIAPGSHGQSGLSLADLSAQQLDADRRHGFPVDLPNGAGRRDQLLREIVGLVGEVGEFANLLKKVDLAATHHQYSGPDLDAATPELRLELADAQIYLLRLAHFLRIDLTEAVLEKVRANEGRYGHLGHQ